MLKNTARPISGNTPIGKMRMSQFFTAAQAHGVRPSELVDYAAGHGLDISRYTVEDVIDALISADESGRE